METLQMIEKKGVVIPVADNVISINDQRYMERYLLEVEETFAVIFNVYDTHIDEICYETGFALFSKLYDAYDYYRRLNPADMRFRYPTS